MLCGLEKNIHMFAHTFVYLDLCTRFLELVFLFNSRIYTPKYYILDLKMYVYS